MNHLPPSWRPDTKPTNKPALPSPTTITRRAVGARCSDPPAPAESQPDADPSAIANAGNHERLPNRIAGP